MKALQITLTIARVVFDVYIVLQCVGIIRSAVRKRRAFRFSRSGSPLTYEDAERLLNAATESCGLTYSMCRVAGRPISDAGPALRPTQKWEIIVGAPQVSRMVVIDVAGLHDLRRAVNLALGAVNGFRRDQAHSLVPAPLISPQAGV